MKHNLRLAVALVLGMVASIPTHAESARVIRHSQSIPGRWMILLKTPLPSEAADGIITSIASTYNLNVTTRWTERTLGFVCDGATEAAIAAVVDDHRVAFAEQDFQIDLAATQYTTWRGNYLWDLDRVDETSWSNRDNTYNMCPEARTVYAYIIDTGVRRDHEQFAAGEPAPGRVVKSLEFDSYPSQPVDDTTNGCSAYPDSMWHGTAVASKLAGSQVGTSKTKIVSLRIFNCAPNPSSQASWAVGAIEWIRSSSDPYRYAAGLVNWSGGLIPFYNSGDIGAVSTAVQNLVNMTWIPFFVAADNFAGDACKFMPASLAYTNVNHSGLVFTVGGSSVSGTDPNDPKDYRYQKWTNGLPAIGVESGSNGGSCVSIYAPATGIYAARNSSATAYAIADGTSFSAPLVAGIAARYMERTGTRNYQAVFNYLLNAAQATIYNVNTPEYWICKFNDAYFTSRTYISSCNAFQEGSIGQNGTDVPVHMVATYNGSNARMIYSDMTCP